MPTILELFKNKELTFSGTTADGLVDSKSQENRGGVGASISNYIEQETTGVRVKSLVDINNPLIYGNQAIRIAQRTTSDKDAMTNGLLEGGGGGLGLNKVIGKARDAVNSFLGIPVTLLPSRMGMGTIGDDAEVGKNGKKLSETPSNVAYTKETWGKNGTGLGALLKASGGNPSTIAKQAVGGALNAGKDALRGAIFGKPGKLPNNVGKIPIYRSYSNMPKEVDEKNTEGNYSKTPGLKGDFDKGDVNARLGIGMNAPTDTIQSNTFDTFLYHVPNAVPTVDSPVVPFWIQGVEEGEDARQFFRATITGLSESSTPAWQGNKFIGNPYNYYTYDGVERSVTFNMNLYSMNMPELIQCWNRLKYLTAKTYPKISQSNDEGEGGGLVNPPFIRFQLGDLYNDRHGFIESLTYTMPDMGTWEVYKDGLRLPKFIDVALTIKLLETPGAELKLYDYNGEIEGETVKDLGNRPVDENPVTSLF
tara:strand:- start:4679 stop:6112 length:1434 start_codon:yes stop_codon:yes gene_type:complete